MLYLGPALFDDTSARRKALALFSYPSAATDLTDGMIVSAVLATTTYGAGKSVQQSAAAVAYTVGAVDHAVDASLWDDLNLGGPHRLIKVVVAGVKVDALGDGSVTIGSAVVGGAAGVSSNATIGTNDGYIFGVALEDDSPTYDCLIYPRWLV